MSTLTHDPEAGEPADPEGRPDVDFEEEQRRLEAIRRMEFVNATARAANDLAAFGRFVADHPDLPTPELTRVETYREDDRIVTYQIMVLGFDAAAEMTRIARILNDGAGKGEVVKVQEGDYFRLQRRFGSVLLEAWTMRDAVCERVQVGTETIEKPDPEALAAVPKITEDVPVFEWRCSPLLDPERPGPAMARAALEGAGSVNGTPADVTADRMLALSGVELMREHGINA